MQLKYSGSVHFANGDPVSGVSIRIFDKDAHGKVDDDLTITPGLSDVHGAFTLTFEPLRYLDYDTLSIFIPQHKSRKEKNVENGTRFPDLDDIYLPYLQFNYTFNGLNNTHTASMGIFQTRYYLPENPPVAFLPSTHGFRFVNHFSGYFLPFSTPAFMSSRKVNSIYGLCGGMCAATYDLALAGKLIPAITDIPRPGTRLHRYLFQRQMDSLGGLGQEVIKVAQWTSLPDDTAVGTQRRTANEWVGIRQKLDQKNLVILTMIYVHASSVRELARNIFNNHQVLAYAYQMNAAGEITINIYDPNLPGCDDVVIQAEPVNIGEQPNLSSPQPLMGLKCIQLVEGEPYRPVRGFFITPYTPVRPPKGI